MYSYGFYIVSSFQVIWREFCVCHFCHSWCTFHSCKLPSKTGEELILVTDIIFLLVLNVIMYLYEYFEITTFRETFITIDLLARLRSLPGSIYYFYFSVYGVRRTCSRRWPAPKSQCLLQRSWCIWCRFEQGRHNACRAQVSEWMVWSWWNLSSWSNSEMVSHTFKYLCRTVLVY